MRIVCGSREDTTLSSVTQMLCHGSLVIRTLLGGFLDFLRGMQSAVSTFVTRFGLWEEENGGLSCHPISFNVFDLVPRFLFGRTTSIVSHQKSIFNLSAWRLAFRFRVRASLSHGGVVMSASSQADFRSSTSMSRIRFNTLQTAATDSAPAAAVAVAKSGLSYAVIMSPRCSAEGQAIASTSSHSARVATMRSPIRTFFRSRSRSEK